MYSVKENLDCFFVANLIFKNNLIMYFSGRSEAGCRALGNRSILSNPLMPFARNILNEIKGREWFRPIAATILKEEYSKWFFSDVVEETPFMTYTAKMKQKNVNFCDSILHVDGTCRIQTLTKSQNENYYNLLKCFHQLSNIPILLNTSFNLAGEPIVETPRDAINSFINSNFKYLFFADVNTLLYK